MNVYLILMNAASFLLMLVDKLSAKKKLRRVPEAVLFTAALMGGSLGVWLGMYTCRHKTRHPKFVIGVPLILAAQVALLLLAK